MTQMESEIQKKIEEANSLLDRCGVFCNEKPELSGMSQLERKIAAEKSFLLEVLSKGPTAIHPSHVRCSNLIHFRALLDAIPLYTDVKSVLTSFSWKKGSLRVDLVAEHGFLWLKVIARNPQSLYRVWEGMGECGEKSIVDQGETYIAAAKHNCNPRIVFRFAYGVPDKVAAELEELGIEVHGERVTVKPFVDDVSSSEEEDAEAWSDVYDSLVASTSKSDHIGSEDKTNEHADEGVQDNCFYTECPANRPINLDITALFALVSSLTNGDGAKYRFEEPLLDEQAGWERKRPVMPYLNRILKDRRLLVSQTALDAFKAILDVVGGPTEQKRADLLLQRVEVVPDVDMETASVALRNLKIGGRIKPRSKIIFGTGESRGAITVTANKGFVQAAYNMGVKFAVIIHESRALSEQKQEHATPIEQCDREEK